MSERDKAEYRQMVERRTPRSHFVRDTWRAFWVGGLICALSEGCTLWLMRGFNFARQDAATLTSVTLDRRSVNLSRMLEQIADEFAPMLRERGLSCAVNAPSELMISCDPDKLQRVFDNLLRNAMNYSYSNTEISITLSVEGERAEIVFVNRGDTIPAPQLERLFEQFYRLDSARMSRTGGSGLGLAIAKEIVELHGGSISAQSADERIIFTVLLPLGNVRKS